MIIQVLIDQLELSECDSDDFQWIHEMFKRTLTNPLSQRRVRCAVCILMQMIEEYSSISHKNEWTKKMGNENH